MSIGFYLEGLALGVGAAAPLGPVNLEIIRRGLTRGYRSALMLGLGACSADMIYLSLVLAGVTRWAQTEVVRLVMLTAGGCFLLFLAALAAIGARKAGQAKLSTAPGKIPTGHLVKGYLTGLGMTLSNPMTIAFWLSVSAQLSSRTFNWTDYSLSLGGVASGTVGWVLTVSALSAAGRKFVGPKVLVAANLIGAAVLAGFGVRVLYVAAQLTALFPG